MPKETIAKFLLFVIVLIAAAMMMHACGAKGFAGKPANMAGAFGDPKIIGNIESKDVRESSGLVVSRCQKNVLWTENDSGGGPYLYAFSPTGNNLGTWKVPNVVNIDWEDLAGYKDASGKCYIYIGEIGDNNVKRPIHSVYRIPEPQVV